MTMTAIETITDEQIEALETEAAMHGDTLTESLCARALEGDQDARREVAEIIAYARNEAAYQDGIDD